MAKTPAKPFNFQEFVSKLTKNEKTLALITGFVIFVALMYGLMVGPVLTKMKLIDTDIAAKREEIRRDRRIISFKDRILEEYAKSNTYLDSTEKNSEEIIAALLKKIENLAKQHTITVKDIRPGDVEVKPQFQIYKTSMDCEGTLPNVLEFMNALEQSDYLFQITRYSIAPKSKGADIMKSTMDIARHLIQAEKLDPGVLPIVEKTLPSFPEMPAVETAVELPSLPLPLPETGGAPAPDASASGSGK